MIQFTWNSLSRFLAKAHTWTGIQTFSNIVINGGSIAASVVVDLVSELAAPPAIGGTAPAAGTFTTIDATTDFTLRGTTGGLVRKFAEATVTISAASSCTITLNIPINSRIVGTQLRVDTALTAGDLWDAAFSGGSTAALCVGQAVAQNTKVISLTTDVTTGTADIAITKNGGGSFTAAGVIRAIVYYDTFDAMASL